jgi:hypothetical protein
MIGEVAAKSIRNYFITADFSSKYYYKSNPFLVFLRIFCYNFIYVPIWALSSAWLERYLDMVEVIGSSPIEPTVRTNLKHGEK